MEENPNLPVETPSDHDEPDVVVKPKKKMNLSEERRQQLRERMKVIAAERHAKLKEAREERIKAWNQDPPPRPCDIGKGKYKHQPKPVVHDKLEESSDDDLPDPSAVLDKQKKTMEDSIRYESEASKRAAHNKAVASQLREDKKREAAAKKAYEEQVLDLKREREKLEKEKKEFEERLMKDKPPPEKPKAAPEKPKPAPAPAPSATRVTTIPTPSAPLIRGKFVR